MGRIAIWMSPEPGHLFPALKVAADLLARGHNVLLPAPAGIATELEALGFSAARIQSGWPMAGTIRLLSPTCTAAEFLQSAVTALGGWRAVCRGFQQELRRTLAEWGADLFVVDGSHDEAFDLITSRVFDARKLLRLFPHMNWDGKRVTSFFGPLAPAAVLAPPVFAFPDIGTPHLQYTEAALFAGAPGGPGEPAHDGLPIIYVSLGSQAASYPGAASVLAATARAARACPDLSFVISTGGITMPTRNANWLEAAPRLPQRKILERAALMITHGGLGSIKECIWHRVPMLVAPQAYDQPANAARVTRHGLGSVLPDGAGECEIEHAIRSLLVDERCRERIRAMSEQFRLREAEMATARMCEAVMGRRSR